MSTQRIEIKIASRHYPMTINSDEEEMLLSCAEEINSILKQFEQKYAVSDKQDALAMVTIQLALREAKLKKQVKDNEEMTTERISKLLELIDQSIVK
ncbi:cell division protein ZapA [Empedobacter stercoris]|uniref:Cell division protein ZapA n=2 Tax=Empedobacter TaxID=59734 RepID=A0ABY8VCV3_9FLAO|nr:MULTISPECIES: cell division protein ZapA [Empedobacter]MCA4776220.1 cell division protein ZapA [Empedobacter stercoris]MCA4781515.1 cell division protein ZapA [Empedobacter stercoris]MCA4808638.1 cell division protein ZapA [Empedobacter stercoris]MDM1523636.1 cell division protein ZapA [Empedobacter sp. 225-1]MDM1543076.1 cell division protein ZapA [Empedobacter sp. 189-2]